MENGKIDGVGYIKYEGKSVEDGVIDAAAAGSALISFSRAVRFFNEKQSPQFAQLDYEVPVVVEKGSWVVWLIGGVGAIGTAFAMGYAKKAGEKLAENDFKEVGLKDVLKKSMQAVTWLAKLVKHTKKNKDWHEQKNTEWRNNNLEIGIKNENGEIIFVPIEFFRWYVSVPPSLLQGIIDAIDQNRVLTIACERENSAFLDEVVVNEEDKPFFIAGVTELEDDYLFPELKHGDEVRLEGKLTRGNESNNSVGFEYQGHILNCIPESGSIRRYKSALFLRCVVEGSISRLTKQRHVGEKRPTILIKNVTPLEADDQYKLFESQD